MKEYESFGSIYIMTTNRCNLRCSYCYETNRSGDMSLDVAKRTVDWLVGQRGKHNNSSLSLTFFGGEPLLRPKFIRDVVQYSIDSKQNIGRWGILTNGTIWDAQARETLLYMKEHCEHFTFQVSLDGGAESHDKHRLFANGRNTFSVIMDNVECFKKIIPNMIFRQTVMPSNVDRLADDFKMMYDACGEHGNVSLTAIVEGGWEDKSIATYKEQIAKILEMYENSSKSTYFNLLDGTLQRLMNHELRRSRGCGAGRTLACVTIDGDIYPCHRFASYAHINDHKIGTIYDGVNRDSAVYQKVVNIFGSSEKCNACKITNCNMCMATNMALGEGLSYNAPEGYCKLGASINKMLEDKVFQLVASNRMKMKVGDIVRRGEGGFMSVEPGKSTEFKDNEDLYAQSFLGIFKQLSEIKKDMIKIKQHLGIANAQVCNCGETHEDSTD